MRALNLASSQRSFIAVLSLLLALGTAASADTAKPPEVSPADPPAQIGPQIVGGEEVSDLRFRRHYRFMVALVTPTGTQFCGGTLIDEEWVLTAAHCLPGQTPATVRIVVNTPLLSSGGTTVEVAGLVPHPNYNSSTEVNDIALIRLATPVALPTVGVATQELMDSSISTGTRVTALGWGDTSEGGTGSDRLREVRLPVVPNGRCRRANPGSTITRFQLCVGRRAGGIDTCQGDSGGPLVLLTDQGYRQVGITSWGTGCARADTYAVYARVASYLTWIEAVMGGVPTCIDRDLVTVIRRPADYQCFGLPNNDDSSSNPALIGFPVRLGGAVFTAVYVNNNGNLTFGGPLSTYTPLDLTSQPHPMIAPFFADVDTRGAESRIVYYGQGVLRGRRTFSAIWQRIGYYSHHTDRLNTFQVVLTETAPGSGNFSIEFNYGPIEWETGDASDGEGGLGGYSARVGLSLVAGVPDFTIELPGSGIPGSFIEGGTSPLSSSSNLGIPGRYYWTVYNGEAR